MAKKGHPALTISLVRGGNMRKWVMSFTYQPKIDGVRSGNITQTIRGAKGIKVGDEILFHGWSGLPYRSKWNWRLRVVVTDVLRFWFDEGRVIPQDAEVEEDGYLPVWRWDDPRVDELAQRDGIDPPFGEDLKETLKSLNGKDWESYYEVIRWRVKK